MLNTTNIDRKLKRKICKKAEDGMDLAKPIFQFSSGMFLFLLQSNQFRGKSIPLKSQHDFLSFAINWFIA